MGPIIMRTASVFSNAVSTQSGVQTSVGITITGPVGRAARCPNRPDDVFKIQQALNSFPAEDGGSLNKLKEDGKCWDKTKTAILHFQKKRAYPNPDGVVDIDGDTIRALRRGPAKTLSVSDQIERGKATAFRAVQEAVKAIRVVSLYHAGKPIPAESIPSQVRFVVAFERCFHGSRSNMINQMARYVEDRIFHVNRQLIKVTSDPEKWFAIDYPRHEFDAYAFAWPGGYLKGGPGDGYWAPYDTKKIYFTPLMRLVDNDAVSYAMIHELAHYVDSKSVDAGVFHRNKAKFEGLSPYNTLINAD